MEARRDVFQAIADPTRREIIRLTANSPQNLKSIAANFAMSRQAITLHINILAECGLLALEKRGRERYCEARLEKLQEVQEWADKYKAFWTIRLRALKDFLEQDGLTKTKKASVRNSKRRKE